jgi:hypothetical protein
MNGFAPLRRSKRTDVQIRQAKQKTRNMHKCEKKKKNGDERREGGDVYSWPRCRISLRKGGHESLKIFKKKEEHKKR